MEVAKEEISSISRNRKIGKVENWKWRATCGYISIKYPSSVLPCIRFYCTTAGQVGMKRIGQAWMCEIPEADVHLSCGNDWQICSGLRDVLINTQLFEMMKDFCNEKKY